MMYLHRNNEIDKRFQCVKLGNSYSPLAPAISGVPQGNVLEPTLFLLFINDVRDIFSHLSVSFKLFADDIKLYSCYDITFADDLCIAVKQLCDWSTVWQLNISVE